MSLTMGATNELAIDRMKMSSMRPLLPKRLPFLRWKLTRMGTTIELMSCTITDLMAMPIW